MRGNEKMRRKVVDGEMECFGESLMIRMGFHTFVFFLIKRYFLEYCGQCIMSNLLICSSH